jgi:glycine cleavage system aminomethyltransferase T
MSSTYDVVKRSPLRHVLAEAGAQFSRISGWDVAVRFGDVEQEVRLAQSGVGLSDSSFTTKWEMQGADLSQILASMFFGKAPTSGRAIGRKQGYVARPSRNQAMFISDLPMDWAREIAQTPILECFHLVERTSGFSHLVLCGPKAQPLLRTVTPLDTRDRIFPNFCCAWGPMAGIRVLLVRNDRKELPAYEILVGREYAEYLWNALTESGCRFQIRPLGFESMRLLEG